MKARTFTRSKNTWSDENTALQDVIAKQNLETEKHTQNVVSNSVIELVHDVNLILSGNASNLKTSTAREDFLKFQSRKKELESKISQAQINFVRNKGLYEKNIIHFKFSSSACSFFL